MQVKTDAGEMTGLRVPVQPVMSHDGVVTLISHGGLE